MIRIVFFFKYFSIFLLLVLGLKLGFGQSREINGTVYNAMTGKTLSGISVALKGTSIVALSNLSGEYSLTVPDSIKTIEFSDFQNMDVIEIRPLNESRIDIYLSGTDFFSLSLDQLMNLSVTTASKRKQLIADIPASVYILTRKEIESYGATSLEELFSQIPGLYYVNNESFLGPTIGIRGYMTANPTNIVVLVNGVPQQNDLHNSFSFHECPLPVEAIDRIEVIRGPMSVMYGSNAFFGAINIITNKMPDDNQIQTNLSVAAGNYGLRKALVTSRGKSGEIEYAVNLSYYKDDGIDEPFYKMVSNLTSKYEEWGLPDTLVTSKGYFTTDQKYINLSGKIKDFYLETGFAFSTYGQSFSSLFYLPAQCKSGFSKTAVGYRHSFSEQLTLNTKITYSRYDLQMGDNYFSTDTNGFGNESDIYSFGQYWSEKVEGEINLFYHPLSQLTVSLNGYQAAILDAGDKTDAPYNASPNLVNRAGGVRKGDHVNITAVYAQADYDVTNWLKLVLSGRVERMGSFDLVLYRGMYTGDRQKFTGTFDNDKLMWVPRAAVIAKASKNHIFKAMYGEAIKLPAVWELRNNLTVGKSLEPERIKTVEVNYLATFSSKVNANISYFRNDISDVVLRSIIFDGTNYSSYFTNGARILTNGAEATFKLFPAKKIETELSMIVQNSIYRSVIPKSIPVEFSPKILGYLKATYQVNKNFIIGLTGNYVDKMEAQWDNTPQVLSDPNSGAKGRYGKPVNSYMLFGLNLRVQNLFNSKESNNKGFVIDLKVNNLFNQEIHYPSTSVSAWADKGVIGFGRSIQLNIGYKL